VEINVTCYLQMERETLQVFYVYLISALCDHPLWHCRCQAINLLLPIPAAGYQVLLWWPWKLPNLMPCDFFLMGICYGLHLSTASTTGSAWAAAISETDHDMLQQIWLEMDYRPDVCHVSLIEGRWREFLYPFVAFMLQSLPTFKCTTCMKYARELWITRHS